MRKMNLLWLRLTVEKQYLISLMATAMVLGCNQASGERQEMASILEQLDPTNSEVNRIEAVDRVKRLGTNAFPLLIAEMNSFKWHTPQEKDQAIIDRTRRLRMAFEVFGTNLVQLTNEFVKNLNTNRNFVSAMDGIVATGEKGIPYLIAALTNREAAIRLNAVAGILKVARTSPEKAKRITPSLIPIVKDEFVLVRSLATETLGLYCDNSNVCTPALLEVALEDTDEVVRCQAIKAVGRIQARVGTISPNTKSVLEKIYKHDNSRVVRQCAERALAQENGK